MYKNDIPYYKIVKKKYKHKDNILLLDKVNRYPMSKHKDWILIVKVVLQNRV